MTKTQTHAHTLNGRKMLASAVDTKIHLLADDFCHSLCGIDYVALRIATERELTVRGFCLYCHAASQPDA